MVVATLLESDRMKLLKLLSTRQELSNAESFFCVCAKKFLTFADADAAGMINTWIPQHCGTTKSLQQFFLITDSIQAFNFNILLW